MKLTLIALAVACATTPAMAVDFSLSNANTSNIKAAQWQCKGCQTPELLSGELSVGVGFSQIDDIHAANALGQQDTGAVTALNGWLNINQEGWRIASTAHNLGMRNGDAGLSISKDNLKLYANYEQRNYLKSDKATTAYYFSDDQLTSGAVYSPVLGVERNRVTLGADAQTEWLGLDLSGDVAFHSEEKQGHKRVSVTTRRPLNLAQPIDSRTDELLASSSLSGSNWLTTLAYAGSFYNNHVQEVYHDTFGSLLAPDPDNEAHQVTLSGNIRGQQSVFDASVAAGRIIQDDALVNAQISPIQNWDGQLNTLDINANYLLMATDKLRLVFNGRYNERDNQSSRFEFPQLDFNAKTGLAFTNVLLDTKATKGSAKFQYRLASGYRLDAGYQFDRNERSFSDRETTDEQQLWAKLKVSQWAGWKVELKGGLSQRDGSHYQANRLTSTETNPLLRMFYLADRDRVETELKLFHQPWSSVAVTMNLKYAKDDYDHTKIGLTDDQDYSYQLGLDYLATKHLSLYSFVSQQWIDANQSSNQWQATIHDKFVSAGGGFEYSGLLQNTLSLGGDYTFSNSRSDANVSAVTTPDDDDYQFSHSLSLYAKYRLSERSQLGINYQYERYYDTDYANVAVDAINGLLTLGELDHNYNAHQLMLNYSISL